MLDRIAKWRLERQGHHVVNRGSIQMVLSGCFCAQQLDDGSYVVTPIAPDVRVVALNYSVIFTHKQVY